MPGADDPTNFTMPQQPFHQCLLPRSARYSTLKRVTNPYEAYIGRRLFLGASGQILDDLKKYTASSTGFKAEKGEEQTPMDVDEQDGSSGVNGGSWSLELMQQLLKWRHMAPTAPDTLPCYPFCDIDPFVLRECPHVFFCGNQVRWYLITTGLIGHINDDASACSFETPLYTCALWSSSTTGTGGLFVMTSRRLCDACLFVVFLVNCRMILPPAWSRVMMDKMFESSQSLALRRLRRRYWSTLGPLRLLHYTSLV